MNVVVLQSNYIPWKGYFDLIAASDLFIFYDDVQYTKNDWRNRNKIKSSKSDLWLTIPCGTNLNRLINEVRVDKLSWQEQHYSSIKNSYQHASYWEYCLPLLEDIYLQNHWTFLSELNTYIIQKISREYLGLETKFQSSTEYKLEGRKQDRLMDLLRQAGASQYITGPSAKNYLDEQQFEMNGIQLNYLNYEKYTPYNQVHPPFSHNVSLIDLLICEGPNASQYLLNDGKNSK